MASSHHIDLKAVRSELGLSQQEFADMLGVSVRTVQSCEQGWRNPSAGVEKAAVLILVASRPEGQLGRMACWEFMPCPDGQCPNCLVHRTRLGHLCWLLTGNVCRGRHLRSWEDKKETCLECPFFRHLLPDGLPMVG